MSRSLVAFTALCVIATVGCGGKSSAPVSPDPGGTRHYNGTASVGDFLNLSIDASAHTLSFVNRSNGDSGTVSYTVSRDGSYAIDDPSHNLVSAYEVPNFVLLIQAARTGPDHATPSLITAVQSSPISLSSIEDHRYNYMQFRTASGGFEAGSCIIDGAGIVTNSSFWPYGAQSGDTPFNTGHVSVNGVIEDPSGTFLRLPDEYGGSDYVFGTPNGVFAVDTQNGAILGFAQAASKDFDVAVAGTYHVSLYEKTGATTGVGNVESGTPALASGTMTVSSSGAVTLSDGSGVLATGTLSAVADTPYLYGSPSLLADACNGLFTFRTTTASSQQDVFVTFVNGAVLFSSYQTGLPMNGGNPYDYFYGVGLR